MGRPSQSQPEHRRPAWAKNENAYKTYISHPTVRPRAPGDFGLDNFSYSEAHVTEWQLPANLAKYLPQELGEPVKDFVYGGAALCTALDRVKELDKEAIVRTDPATTHGHLLNRRASDQTPTVVGAEAPTINSVPAIPFTPAHSITPRQSTLIQNFPQLPLNIVGLESPPYTPFDSKVLNTPVSGLITGPRSTLPDLDSVTAQLSPLSPMNSLTVLPPGLLAKNKKAWEYYVGELNEHVVDLRKNALARLKGSIRTTDRIITQLNRDREVRMKRGVALDRFAQWWETMKAKVSKYEDKVQDLEEKVAVMKRELGHGKPEVAGASF